MGELQEWDANIDIQAVFNHYKAVICMYIYFSNAEVEISENMR